MEKIIYISCTRLDYSLNSVLIKGLRENNIQILDIHVMKGIPGLFKALSFYRRNLKGVKIIITGYNSQILVPWLKLLSRKKIIYNASLSEYERMVISRKLASPMSLKGIYYWFLDFIAVHFADLTLLESEKQVDFFNKLFKVSKDKLYCHYVGCDEDKFYYDPSVLKPSVFTVMFRGAFMPEAGVEYIIKAAKILEDKGINFTLIGGGLLTDKIEKIKRDLNPKNLKHITGHIPYDDLRKLMLQCHLSLGQLSDHTRLTRTTPHKVFESLAMRLPYLTAPSSGVMEILTPEKNCLLCNSADEKSLADKILWIKNNYSEAQRIAEDGYRLFDEKLRSKVTALKFLSKLESLS